VVFFPPLFNADLRVREEVSDAPSPTVFFRTIEVRMAIVMDADRMSRSLVRIGHEILEHNRGVEDLALVGIRARGVPIAARLARTLQELTGHTVRTGALDITLYRDDLMRHAVGPQPVIRSTDISFSIDDKLIVLVDDVLYTGRTIRAALDALIDFGRPRAIQLVVLVDRGHRELPIRADYVGRNIPTSRQQSVQVRLQEIDGRDEVEVEG
jgi:pyrimidine operon attenuation protein/uracil phosphoribosyltransferase